jgi:hypothetical protein
MAFKNQQQDGFKMNMEKQRKKNSQKKFEDTSFLISNFWQYYNTEDSKLLA